MMHEVYLNSNTSHLNKASSANVKWARFTGRGSRSTAMLP